MTTEKIGSLANLADVTRFSRPREKGLYAKNNEYVLLKNGQNSETYSIKISMMLLSLIEAYMLGSPTLENLHNFKVLTMVRSLL